MTNAKIGLFGEFFQWKCKHRKWRENHSTTTALNQSEVDGKKCNHYKAREKSKHNSCGHTRHFYGKVAFTCTLVKKTLCVIALSPTKVTAVNFMDTLKKIKRNGHEAKKYQLEDLRRLCQESCQIANTC